MPSRPATAPSSFYPPRRLPICGDSYTVTRARPSSVPATRRCSTALDPDSDCRLRRAAPVPASPLPSPAGNMGQSDCATIGTVAAARLPRPSIAWLAECRQLFACCKCRRPPPPQPLGAGAVDRFWRVARVVRVPYRSTVGDFSRCIGATRRAALHRVSRCAMVRHGAPYVSHNTLWFNKMSYGSLRCAAVHHGMLLIADAPRNPGTSEA